MIPSSYVRGCWPLLLVMLSHVTEQYEILGEANLAKIEFTAKAVLNLAQSTNKPIRGIASANHKKIDTYEIAYNETTDFQHPKISVSKRRISTGVENSKANRKRGVDDRYPGSERLFDAKHNMTTFIRLQTTLPPECTNGTDCEIIQAFESKDHQQIIQRNHTIDKPTNHTRILTRNHTSNDNVELKNKIKRLRNSTKIPETSNKTTHNPISNITVIDKYNTSIVDKSMKINSNHMIDIQNKHSKEINFEEIRNTSNYDVNYAAFDSSKPSVMTKSHSRINIMTKTGVPKYLHTYNNFRLNKLKSERVLSTYVMPSEENARQSNKKIFDRILNSKEYLGQQNNYRQSPVSPIRGSQSPVGYHHLDQQLPDQEHYFQKRSFFDVK